MSRFSQQPLDTTKFIETKATKKVKTPASALTKTLRNNLRTHEDYISKVAIKTIKGGV